VKTFILISILEYRCVLDLRGSVRHSTIHYREIQQDATVYQNFIIPYLYEA